MKMCDGNPGALRVLCECLKDGATIDPDGFAGGLGAVLGMDTLKVYGPRIWMLYKDVCDHDLRVMIAVLRAWQLGFLTEAALNKAVDSYGAGIDVPDLVALVEARLPKFQRAPVAVTQEEVK